MSKTYIDSEELNSEGTSFIVEVGSGQEKSFENVNIQKIYTEADFFSIISFILQVFCSFRKMFLRVREQHLFGGFVVTPCPP